jgi:transposase
MVTYTSNGCRADRPGADGQGHIDHAADPRIGDAGFALPSRTNANEHRSGPFDRTIYRLRNRVERLINRLKQLRRVATRCEKRAECYRAVVTVAAIMLWL